MLNERINLFITGAGGFIGTHLMRALAGQPVWCYLLVRPEDKRPEFSGGNYEWVTGDLNDPGSYHDALSKCSVVIHMAAELYNPERFDLVNVQGVQNLISAVKQCDIRRVIHLSSVGVAGMQFSMHTVSVNEDFPCDPKNGYEWSKYKSEQLLREQIPAERLVILRPTNVYGEHHPANHLLNLFRYINHHKNIYVSAKAYVNYVYAGDVAAAIHHFIRQDVPAGIYNVGSPMEMTSFVNLLGRLLEKDLRVRKIPGFLFSFAYAFKKLLPAKYRLKILSLRNAVRYADDKLRTSGSPMIGYEQGLRNTIRDYRERNLLND